MIVDHHYPTLRLIGVPALSIFSPFPVVCFTGALVSDIAYYGTATIQWANFSAWLLAAGIFMGGFAALFQIIELVIAKGPRPSSAWFHLIGTLSAIAIAFVNSFVHARDGWTSVVPTGLTLSAITVVILILAGFFGHRSAYARESEV